MVREFERQQIGQRIAQSRNESGLTQEELADAVGVSTRAVQLWEAGDNIPFKRLSRIGEVVARPVMWIIHGEEHADADRLDQLETQVEELLGLVRELLGRFDAGEAPEGDH